MSPEFAEIDQLYAPFLLTLNSYNYFSSRKTGETPKGGMGDDEVSHTYPGRQQKVDNNKMDKPESEGRKKEEF